ncbi:MAG: BACON domain-containing protein, partial [Bryobacteraceae bacterium]
QASLSVSPSQVSFQTVAGGFLGIPQAVNVTSVGPWTASPVGRVQWLTVTPAKGAASGTLTISVDGWAQSKLAPGTHSAEIAVAPDAMLAKAQRIKVTITVAAPSPAPVFTYLDGPHGCTQIPGHDDPAVCVVPGEKPPGNFAPPARGGSYVDPNFGAPVRIMTDPPSSHMYSSPSSLSAGNKYALAYVSGGWSVVSPTTGKVLRGSTPANEPRGTMWDATDPETFYFFDESTIGKYNVRTGRTSKLIDLYKGPLKLTDLRTGGATDTSKDNWVSFLSPPEKMICAADLNTSNTYCASYQNLGPVTLDPTGRGALIAKGIDRETGKRYVILAAAPTLAVFSVNLAEKKLDFEYLGPENLRGKGNKNGICEPGESCYTGDHNDTFEDANGIQYLAGSLEVPNPCSFGIYSLQLNKGKDLLLPAEVGGGTRQLLKLFSCGGVDTWTDVHVGCAKQSPYCVVSTTYGGFNSQRDRADRTPIKRTAHLSEIMVFSLKDNRPGQRIEVRRLAQHRTVPFTGEEANSYWTLARACISNDGAYVIADSNFGEPSKSRVIVIETGYGTAKAAAFPPEKPSRQ